MNGRRGFALMDLMVTLGLIAIALSIAAVLLSRSMKLTDRAAEADAVVRRFEQMQTMLSRDVAGASELAVEPRSIVTSTATWRVDAARVVRTSAGSDRTFEIDAATLRFMPAGYGATLVIESDGRELTRVPLVNVTRWGKESLR